ncbi:MAG TPA: pyroglutamyl-peptidase I [Xanthomonadaceae bacterium]|nr:pyroglutamyl-peptidase I [Xanthomonadaceae bacterium]
MPAARKIPTVLLTGFAPFEAEAVNPSWQVVSALKGRRIAGHRVVARELPTEFGASLRMLRHAIREARPRLVLCVGLAGTRSRISLERVAINVDDARIPDNAGRQPVDVPVVRGGPAAYFSTLPIKAMLAALREAGIPVEVSQSAGTFVCNHVFYGLMHALRRRPAIRAGFVHVPWPAAHAARDMELRPSFEQIVRGLRIAVATALATGEDARIAAGAES